MFGFVDSEAGRLRFARACKSPGDVDEGPSGGFQVDIRSADSQGLLNPGREVVVCVSWYLTLHLEVVGGR